MTEKARVLIADDHPMFLDGLKLLLRNKSEISIEALANNGPEVLSFLETQHFDLVLTDLNMPGMSGVELVKTIKQRFPDTKLLVLTMNDDKEIIKEILFAEAEGYLLKNAGKAQLFEAIDDVLSGKTHYESDVVHLMMKQVKSEKKSEDLLRLLSARELEVLKLILQEYTSKEIADQLFISKQTVDTHRAHILQKTESKTLVGLIKMALSAGL